MIGSIIGDVAGSFYEFCNTKSKNFEFFSDRSRFTDDRVLTVATADWLWSMDRKGYAEPYYSCGNGSFKSVITDFEEKFQR